MDGSQEASHLQLLQPTTQDAKQPSSSKGEEAWRKFDKICWRADGSPNLAMFLPCPMPEQAAMATHPPLPASTADWLSHCSGQLQMETA